MLHYILALADDALILGHRISEWCGHGPILEQDIALTNTALDHLGRARSLYQYAAQTFNNLPAQQKADALSSVAISAQVAAGSIIDEDDLAFLRDGHDFKNLLLCEQPNGDWAYTIARSFFYDAYAFYYYSALRSTADAQLAAIAEKSLKEITYHLRWSSEWVIRLGDGTDESAERMQAAINDLWEFTGELFSPATYEAEALAQGYGIDNAALLPLWTKKVQEILDEACLQTPKTEWMQQGGRQGRHTEKLGYILAEMQFMQRTYPNMEW